VHPLVFWNSNILSLFRNWDNWSAAVIFAALILTSVAIFVICIVLDYLRQQLFRITGIDRTVDHYSDKLEALIRTYVR
jgi:hypothetical protein